MRPRYRRLAVIGFCLGAGVLAVLGVVADHPDVPPGPSWTVVNAPSIDNGLQPNRLHDVACAATEDCWAVGHHVFATVANQALFEGQIQHWNGSTWSIVPSPHLSGPYTSGLAAVTCNSSVDCWAVGTGAPQASGPNVATVPMQTLVEHWDGSAWSVVDSPNAPDLPTDPYVASYLEDVVCTGSDNCVAVGYVSYGSTGTSTLAMQWNGSTWTIIPSANSAASNTSLSSVSCAGAADCWAVGSSWGNGVAHSAFVEHWDGFTWSAGVASDVSASAQDDLNQVTCNSAADCWAVGSTTSGNSIVTLIEHWNGASWAIVTSPNPDKANALYGVECTAASDCWATGFTGPSMAGPNIKTLVLHWNGSNWSSSGSPSVVNENSTLNAVKCLSSSDCWSVGNFGSDSPDTLTMHWNGSQWAIVSSPSINVGVLENQLTALDCSAANDCWAVGVHDNQLCLSCENDSGLLMHWDGASWKLWGTLDDIFTVSRFDGVACVTGNNCWAVGSENISSQTLISHWDGLNWNTVAAPPASGELEAATCNSTSDCWAVGYRVVQQMKVPSILHWNGTAWSTAALPDIGTFIDLHLSAVTCASSTDCFAVGETSPGVGMPLLLHWNGTAWSTQSLVGEGTLSGVACGGPNDCWIVGSLYVPGFPSVPGYANIQIAHWDGITWSPVATPSSATLRSVTCVTANHCYAAGGDGSPLIEEWNGVSWSIVPTESSPDGFGVFNGIHCQPGGYCFAVGASGQLMAESQNFVEGRTFNDVLPTPTPTPTPTATPVPTATPSPSPSPTPVVSVAVSPFQVLEGADATFTVSASPNTVRPVTVFYSMSGKAVPGTDYTLDGVAGQITIPVGQDSASVVLHALNDTVKEKGETVVMTLNANSSYSFGGAAAAGKKKKKTKTKMPSASVTIVNVRS